jgi:CAAX prenyl protease-like protein
MADRRDHGWWPYLLPLFSFLALVEVGRRFPAEAAPLLLILKVAVPLLLLARFAARGSYPELRRLRGALRETGLDVAVGLAGAALWVAPTLIDRIWPFLPFDWLRPEAGSGFDPELFGASWFGLALGLRLVGYAIATPFAEELFARSFLCRYIEVFDRGGDFRDVPIANPSVRGFFGVVVYFAITHQGWELPAAIAWAAMTQLWFYHRRDLMALVVVHATSNLSIALFALAATGRFLDPAGQPIDLWFFI